MRVMFTSDLHLGHNAITKYRPIFSSAVEHDRYVLDEMKKLGKRDVLFILGDFIFESENTSCYLKEISEMPVNIKLILGNHDYNRLCHLKAAGIEILLPLVNYKGFWLSHCPIHPHEMRERKGNIHGHLHNETLNDPLYFNVNLDVNNYKFISLDQIREHYNALSNK